MRHAHVGSVEPPIESPLYAEITQEMRVRTVVDICKSRHPSTVRAVIEQRGPCARAREKIFSIERKREEEKIASGSSGAKRMY